MTLNFFSDAQAFSVGESSLVNPQQSSCTQTNVFNTQISGTFPAAAGSSAMDCESPHVVGNSGTCFLPTGNRCLHKNHVFYACGAFSSTAVSSRQVADSIASDSSYHLQSGENSGPVHNFDYQKNLHSSHFLQAAKDPQVLLSDVDNSERDIRSLQSYQPASGVDISSHVRSHPSSSFSRTSVSSELTPMDTSIFAVPQALDCSQMGSLNVQIGSHHQLSYVEPTFSETNIYVNTHVPLSEPSSTAAVSSSQPSVQLPVQKENTQQGESEASGEIYSNTSSLITH